MLEESTTTHPEPAVSSTAHVVHALAQFSMAVRYRRNVVFASLIVAGLAGMLYYMTATPYYRSTAAILVMGTGGDDGLPPSVVGGSNRQLTLMATLQNLFTRDEVIKGAVKELHSTRPDLIDMAEIPKTAADPQKIWADIISENLSATVVKGTRIIEVGYISKDPDDAVAVVGAVVSSYVDFLDRTHKGSAGEFKNILTKEKDELELRLLKKEQELVTAKSLVGDIGIRSGSTVVHPLVQRAVSFNESLIETQKKRVELEASLAAIQAAMRNGEDLQQHIMTVAEVVGEEVLMQSMGFDRRDSYTLAAVERQLLEDRATLKSMHEHLGPAHPEVIAKTDKIHLTEQYLVNYQQRIKNRVKKLQRSELSSMLLNMVRQKLGETWQLEASLQTKFDQAQAEAIKLNGQLARLEMIEHDLQWLRSLNDVLLERISKIELKEEGQELRTPIVQEPVAAARPFSPNLRRVLMMTLAGGLAVGMTLVYVLDILDDRFRSAEEMHQQLGIPVLAMVRQLHAPQTEGIDALQVHIEPNSPESEAFRTLRTALALADRQAKHIVISSAEPSDGKTTVLANLAVSYAQSDKKTLLIDADLRRPGLTVMMGMRGAKGLSCIIRGDGDVAKTAMGHIKASGIEGLDVLSSGPRSANPAELLANQRFSELLAWAETAYDQILIDSPPTLATSDTAMIGRLVDGVVIVVQPEKNRRRMVTRAIESLATLKIPLLGIVVNRVGADGDHGYYSYGYGYGYEPKYTAEEDENDMFDDTFTEESVTITPKRVA